MKAIIFVSITISIVTLFAFYVTRSQTVTVVDKYIKQSMSPKPNATKNMSHQPMCGLDYYNIIVDYYVTDSKNKTHKISEKQYWTINIGDNIKLNS